MTGLTREAAGKIRLLRFNLLVVTERVREILTPAFFSGLFLQLFFISFGQEERQDDKS